MKTRHAAHSLLRTRRLAVWLVLFLAAGGAGGGLVGCGPTRTAGTNGMAAKDLSVLSIPQLPEETHLQIKSIQFDGAGDEYEIGSGHDFYLLPRDHTASFVFKAILPSEAGFAAMFVPKDALTFASPKGIPLGAMTAGKTYELALPSTDSSQGSSQDLADSFDKMLETGQFSLVREKKAK
jgi:hypothetical protein